MKTTPHPRIALLLLLLTVLATACIMPPKGVAVAKIRATDDVAAHVIRVNQTGYFTKGPKLGVWATTSAAPAAFDLIDRSGKSVFSGESIPNGPDRDSGESVHLLDFSAFTGEGSGYSLKVNDVQSLPFDISQRIYEKLSVDSLRYFYLNRSGVPIEARYAGDRKLARPAGHTTDRRMSCVPRGKCKYTKDVWGGWYDAGDYGKYVVNGGVSVWLLLNTFEQSTKRDNSKAKADNINIPESQNGVPDILDEARFELEWIMKMQVTDKEQGTLGMVHHRARELNFTAMGKAPDTKAVEPRYLRDVDTSATLNLAAVGAQAARIFAPFDRKFSKQCRERAELAWQAALTHPEVFAPDNGVKGVGQYQDYEVADNFFWAAAELWITTGEKQYFSHLQGSKYYAAPSRGAGGSTSAFNWQVTDALGTVSLAIGLRELPDASLERHRKSLVDLANLLLDLTTQQGYRYPFRPGTYPWGSNSVVLNNGMILALAAEYTGDSRYLDAAVFSMDYVLGRNPNDFSYVSGYGEIAMGHPHHRFWAPSYDKRLPSPPPGSLSGGPNSSLQDSTVAAYRKGCPGAKCYLDSIESFSTNEVAINWNAILVWLSTWLDDRAPTR